MGVTDHGTPAANDPLGTPSLASWADSVAAALDDDDTSVDTRIAAHNAATTGVHGIADTAALVVDSDLGSAAALDVGTTTGTVAAGDDARLSDARTPTAHAASHAAAGSDPVTIAQSQVTSLVSDLALKAPLASPAFTGNPTAPTPTAGDNDTSIATTAFVTAADVAYAAKLSTVGNLLTANQASGTDTLGTTVGFAQVFYSPTLASSTDVAASGVRSLKVTSTNASPWTAATPSGTSGVPVTPGLPYTVRMRSRAATDARLFRVAIDWYDASGASVSGGTAGSFTTNSTSGWTEHVHTLVAPATAAFMRMAFNGTGVANGEVHYFDEFGIWAGAGGDWQMPGVPITNLGHRVTHPNTDDVLVQKWDAGLGRWQTVHYDSGVRDVSTWLNANYATTGGLRVRRVNERITLTFIAVNTPATYSPTVATIPSGWYTSDPAIAGSRIRDSVNVFHDISREGQFVYVRDTWPAVRQFWGQLTVSDGSTLVIPTSLPGTLVTAAPA